MPLRPGHPLETLARLWPAPTGGRGRDPGRVGDFLAWLAGSEPKHAMRLGWALGLSRDVPELEGLWDRGGGHAAVLGARLAGDPSKVPDALWAAFQRGRGSGAFAPLAAPQPAGPLLAHITPNPEVLFREGFLGTPDPARLASTFTLRKREPGYNFAFRADGFDAANHGADDFYGDDAVLFRAPFLPVYNGEGADEEMVFWGPDAPPSALVHLSRPEGSGDGWAVLAADGAVLFEGGSVPACARWVAANEAAFADRLYGPRAHALRASEDHLPPEDEEEAGFRP